MDRSREVSGNKKISEYCGNPMALTKKDEQTITSIVIKNLDAGLKQFFLPLYERVNGMEKQLESIECEVTQIKEGLHKFNSRVEKLELSPV